MRALLIVNPVATTASRRTREVLAAALDRDLKLEVAHTSERGHAIALASQARTDGMDLVVVLGGDGTVNEVVNGLLADGVHDSVPHLGVVPGGGTNVFARSLGIPRDPVEATGALLDAIRADQRRTIGLGQVDDRWFTFSAGVGLDAAVVAAVDRRRADGGKATPSAYVRTTLHEFFAGVDRRHAPIRVRVGPTESAELAGGGPENRLHVLIVANTSPWTYLGERPVRPTPEASYDTGLDVYGLRRLGTAATLRQVAQLLSRADRLPHGRAVVSAHDLQEIRVDTDREVPVHVDGEYIGQRTRLRFAAVPAALRVAR
ncbi:MAG: hypothetical protein QOE01_1908 [Actinomycetota bacterium]|nr:hypothetical protein [Actinomycetota bacterium]